MTKKTSNAMKAVAQAKEPTPEQMAEEKARILRQKMMAMSESIFIQRAGSAPAGTDPAKVIEETMAMAEAWMGHFYGLRRKEEAEG